MKFMLTIFEKDGGSYRTLDAESQKAYWAAWKAYSEAIHAAGVFAGGSALEAPETATTLRLRQGRTQVQDGPYADSKEQLAGFILVEAPSLDEALRWAERLPPLAYGGAVEVRATFDGRARAEAAGGSAAAAPATLA